MKQTLRASGSNLTPEHMENVSMSALFLLQVAKQTDIEFKTPHQCGHYTIQEAAGDICRMVDHILEQRVTTEHCEVGTPFSNPLTKGAEKIAGGIIEKFRN